MHPTCKVWPCTETGSRIASSSRIRLSHFQLLSSHFLGHTVGCLVHHLFHHLSQPYQLHLCHLPPLHVLLSLYCCAWCCPPRESLLYWWSLVAAAPPVSILSVHYCRPILPLQPLVPHPAAATLANNGFVMKSTWPALLRKVIMMAVCAFCARGV